MNYKDNTIVYIHKISFKQEQKLIDKLEHFLLELGTGFAFVASKYQTVLPSKEKLKELIENIEI